MIGKELFEEVLIEYKADDSRMLMDQILHTASKIYTQIENVIYFYRVF